MNPVLILTHNNLELTKRAVESVRKQDVPTCPQIIDNGSTDGTVEWADAEILLFDAADSNAGVSVGWNRGLCGLFEWKSVSHVLVIGNDTVLAPWTYRWLLSFGLPFVTGVAVDNTEQLIEPDGGTMSLEPHPDFSCFLIRRECWEKVGRFDERMKHYASDTDYHVRAHRLGVPLYKACVPFYHERSSTIRLASPEERQEIETQANKDREVFKGIYGCLPGSKEYEEMFK